MSSSEISLNWADNSDNEDGFRILRTFNPDGGMRAWVPIASVGANITTYSDTKLKPNTTCYYRVDGWNGAGNSKYSNIAEATTHSEESPPNAPSNLNATAVSSSEISLNWADNSDNEDGFRILRTFNPDGGMRAWVPIASVGANITTYSDTKLKPNTTCYYRVDGWNGAGNSEYSNIAGATTHSDLFLGEKEIVIDTSLNVSST